MLQKDINKRASFFLSVCFSFLFHALAIFFLQSHSLWFYSGRKVVVQTVQMQKAPAKRVALTLKPAAPSRPLFGNHEELQAPTHEIEKEQVLSRNLNRLSEHSLSIDKKLMEVEDFAYTKKLLLEEKPPAFSGIPTLSELHAHLLRKDFPLLPLEIANEKNETILLAKESGEKLMLPLPTLPMKEEKYDLPLLEYHAERMERIIHKETAAPVSIITTEKPDLAQIPSLNELDTTSLGELFDAELVYLPQKDGYLFAITMIPKANASIPKLKQNYYFLVDKSNAIQKNRLKVTAHAVLKALSFLDEEDRFNVIAFDNKYERLFLENMPATKANKLAAKNYLLNLQLGSFFSSADPYKPLKALLYDELPYEELATIILITNGDGLTNQNKKPFFLHEWTSQNAGKFSLYSVAMTEDKQINILDLLSSLNKGKLYTTPTFQGIKRRLLKMVKNSRSPIAKDIACFPITRNSANKIDIYPSFQQLPSLYSDQPFVLMGTTKELTDFILFIQGKQKNGWLNIKKTISFLNAKQADASLETQWAIVKSQFLYEKYLREGNPLLLKEAHTVLEERGLPATF